MQYERLASELFRRMRGRRSQVAMSRRLGYRANVAYVWENGRRFPLASTLFRLAALNEVEVGQIWAFPRLTPVGTLPDRTWARGHVASWIRALSANTPAAEVARAVGVDRATVARWFKGGSEPRVPELLALVDTMSHRLVEFVALFVNPAELTSIRSLSQDLAAQRRTGYEHPWSHAVLRALELEPYRRAEQHLPGFVAGSIGITRAEEELLLGALERAHQIRRRGNKWTAGRVLTVDTRSDPELHLRLRRHWAEVGLVRLGRARADGDALFSYNLFSVSRADYLRLRELHVEYFERVRRIVAESRPTDRVVLLNLQLIPLEEAVTR